MRTIRWGIIGVGDVTEIKSGPGFRKARNSALVAVMRRDGAKAADYARRHGVPRWYDEGAALVHDPEVDAVYIATPPHVHRQYTELAAAARKPVYVEKPMARTADECRAMIAACAAHGVPLWVAYYRRAQPRYLKVKSLLDSGAIGDVRSVHTELYQPPAAFDPARLPWRVIPEIAGGGLFVDLASHTLDLLDYFLGPIRRVQGIAVNQIGLYPAEDHVVTAIEFESGVPGTGVWCFTADRDADETTITGTRGRITFATFAEAPVRVFTSSGCEEFVIPRPEHVQQPLIQTIVDELNGEGVCPATAEAGLRTAVVLDRALWEYRAASQKTS